AAWLPEAPRATGGARVHDRRSGQRPAARRLAAVSDRAPPHFGQTAPPPAPEGPARGHDALGAAATTPTHPAAMRCRPLPAGPALSKLKILSQLGISEDEFLRLR